MARILIVEDNPANLKLAVMLLEQAGYEAITSPDGTEGLRLAQEIIPDLILMDIQLPGIDGLSGTRLLRENPATSHIPIIALTAFAMAGDEEKIRAAGCDDYISKPYRYKYFLAKINKILGPKEEELP